MSSPTGGTFGDRVDERVTDLGEQLGSELDNTSRHVRRGFERAGEKLDDGAAKLKDGIRQTSDGIKVARNRVSGVLSNSSEYLRSNGAKDIIEDVEGLVKEHPGKALLAVAAVGFLFGRMLTSKD